MHVEVYAAEVANAVLHMWNELADRTRHLAKLHAAPSSLASVMHLHNGPRARAPAPCGVTAPPVMVTGS